MAKRKHTKHKKTSHAHKDSHAHKEHESHEKHTTHSKKAPKKTPMMPYIAAGVIIVIALFFLFGRGDGPTPNGTDNPNGEAASFSGEPVAVDFYVMSECPYGTQVENAIKPVLDQLGGAVDFNLNFIVSETSPGQFQSLHGPTEVDGNIVQLCAAKYNPDSYMDLIVCMNENARAIPGNWMDCATEHDLDVDNIKTCFEGEEGVELLKASMGETNKVGATGSPTIYIDGKSYSGARDTLSFLRTICNGLDDHPECANMPACGTDADCTKEADKIGKCENPGTKEASCTYTDPVKFEVIVLNDKTCSSCVTTQITSTTSQLFKGATHRNVDISSSEGQKLIKELELTVVPAYIFDKKVKDTAGWKENPRIETAFEEAGDYVRLKDEVTQATHFIDKEKQQAYYDSMGLTLGDNKPQIDFYVMSYCPYGNQAEEAIEPVYQLLGDKAEFNPHYVIYSNYQGGGPQYCLDDESLYCSMHGVVELHQDIREYCVDKYFGTGDWFKFALAMDTDCDSKNADTCWTGVADKLGIDKEVVNTCYETEALEISKEELELNKMLGVSGSPTMFIDGQKYAGSRTAEGIKEAMCAAYEDAPSECDQALEGEPAGSAAPAAGACG